MSRLSIRHGAFSRLIRPTKRQLAILLVVLIAAAAIALRQSVQAATATMIPTSDISTGWTVPVGSSTTCANGTHCDHVDDGLTADDADYVSTGSNGAGGEIEEFELTAPTDVQNATQVVLNVRLRSIALGSSADTVGIALRVGSTLQAVTTVTMTTTITNYTVTYNGSWSQFEVENMRIYLIRNVVGSGNAASRDDNVAVYNANATLTYSQPATLTQSTWRMFQNADSVNPGSPLAAQDTAATIQSNTNFRLRQRIAVDGGTHFINGQSMKLQYAEKSGTCDAGFVGESFVDMTPPQYTTYSQEYLAGAAVNDTSRGTVAWSNPGNVTTDDGVLASASSIGFSGTNYIKTSAHGFSVPTDAAISGIELTVERTASFQTSGYAPDSQINLVKGGVIQTTNKAVNTMWMGVITYGGPSDLWSNTWTPADVNSSDFGSAISASIQPDSGSGTVSVDRVSLKVYYSQPTPPGPLRFADNLSPVHETTIASSGNDPLSGSRPTVYQAYLESDPFNNSSNGIAAGSDGLWDFSLYAASSASGKTYCLRTVKATGATLTGYSALPEITIVDPVLTQSNYKWYANANSINPGSSLAADNTAASVAAQSAVRLRQRISVDTAPLTQSTGSYKLQYAEKAGTCSASFGGIIKYVNQTAATSQTRYAGNAVGGGGTPSAWQNLANLYADDNASAVAVANNIGPILTDTIQLTNFGFTLPSDATVTGVIVHGNTDGNFPSGTDNDTYVSTSLGTTSNLASGSPWTEVMHWGSQNNLSGGPWTGSAVNNSFYVDLNAYINFDSSIQLDSVSATVYYTAGSSGEITYSNNSTPVHAATISSSNDPAGRTTVYQTYNETDPFSNTVASIPAGSDGLWDFTIVSSAAAAGKTYCFRTVKADGTPLNMYSTYPEITFTGAGPTLDQQLRGGAGVIGGVKSALTF